MSSSDETSAVFVDDDPKRIAQDVLEQAMQHADLAEADHKTFLDAIAHGR